MSLTRANILEMVRDRIGDDSASPYYASTFINRQIDARVFHHATTRICRLDRSFYMKETTVTSVASTSDYAVPSDFATLVRVERRYGSSAPYTYLDIPIRVVDDQATGSWVSPILALPDTISRSGKTFALFAGYFRIEPIPVDTSEVYRVKYLRRPVTADLTNGAEVMDIPDMWGGYIALDVASIVFRRKGDPRLADTKAEMALEYQNLRKLHRNRTVPGKISRLERM